MASRLRALLVCLAGVLALMAGPVLAQGRGGQAAPAAPPINPSDDPVLRTFKWRSIGPASGRLRVQHSPDSTGSSRAWTWYEARVGWDFTDKLSGSAAIGRREQETSVDYTGYNVGVSYALTRAVELDLRWHGTDVENPGEQYADALVAGISFAF